jgi:DNA-binding NarL/FixJ family response regulator
VNPGLVQKFWRTVVVCDDRQELRDAISLVLSDVPRFRVVGEALDGASCLERVRETLPDVLILDVSMPGGGPELASAAKELHPMMRIVVFSGHQEARVKDAMIRAGADQYVVKTGRLRPLLDALEQVFAAG